MGIEVLGCIQYFSHLKRVFLMRGDKRRTHWKRRGVFFMAIRCPVVQYSVERQTREASPFFDIVQLFQLLLRILKSRLKPNQSAPATQSGSRDTHWCHRFDRFLCSVDARSSVTSDRVKKLPPTLIDLKKIYIYPLDKNVASFEKLTRIKTEKQAVKFGGKAFCFFFFCHQWSGKTNLACDQQLIAAQIA